MLRNAGWFCKSKTGNPHVSHTSTIKEIASVQDIWSLFTLWINYLQIKTSASVVTENMSVLWRKVCIEFKQCIFNGKVNVCWEKCMYYIIWDGGHRLRDLLAQYSIQLKWTANWVQCTLVPWYCLKWLNVLAACTERKENTTC